MIGTVDLAGDEEKMQAKQIYCTQCGAVIPPGEARCPYCGSSYGPEAEREYMRKLDQVRSDLDKVGNIGEETSRTEAGRIRKRVFRILAVILIFSAVIYGIFVFMEKQDDRRNREEYLWRKETVPALNQLYEEGNYDALVEEYQKTYESGHSLYDWEHNAFCEYYEAANYADEILKMRKKGHFEESDAIVLLNEELQFRGLPFRRGIPDEDIRLIQDRIAPFENDLVEVFHASAEELDDFDDMLKKNGGYPEFKACEEYVRNHPEILIKDPDR